MSKPTIGESKYDYSFGHHGAIGAAVRIHHGNTTQWDTADISEMAAYCVRAYSELAVLHQRLSEARADAWPDDEDLRLPLHDGATVTGPL